MNADLLLQIQKSIIDLKRRMFSQKAETAVAHAIHIRRKSDHRTRMFECTVLFLKPSIHSVLTSSGSEFTKKYNSEYQFHSIRQVRLK